MFLLFGEKWQGNNYTVREGLEPLLVPDHLNSIAIQEKIFCDRIHPE